MNREIKSVQATLVSCCLKKTMSWPENIYVLRKMAYIKDTFMDHARMKGSSKEDACLQEFTE